MKELSLYHIDRTKGELKSRAKALSDLKNRVWDTIAEIEFNTHETKGEIRCTCACHSKKFKYSQSDYNAITCAECGNEIFLN